MFKNIVFYFFLFTLLLPNILLSFTEPLTLLGALTNIILPGSVIYLLMSLSPKLGRTVWLMFPLVFFAAFQIVLLDLYGRSVIAVDMFLNLVTTNASEAGELLGNMLTIIAVVIILYVPSLVIATIFIRKKVRLSPSFLQKNFKVASYLVIIGVGMLICSFASPSPYSTTTDLYPVNVGYNIYLAVDRTHRTSDYYNTSAQFCYHSRPTHPAEERELYLLIIGETSRAENWQLLGYGRETTPCLCSRHDIVASEKAYSESNTTHKSVPMLLSPADAMTFDSDIYKVKSVITAFREAGFSTAFISNQRFNHSFIDFFAFESDTTVFMKENAVGSNAELANRLPDSAMLETLDTIIRAGHKKQLIVLHTYGSHFNYLDRYSKDDCRFTPCDYESASKNNREKLVNAYDNTIVATDRFISECIRRIEADDTLTGGIIYASDHGEDIYDNGSGHFLHASPRPSIHQVHVPLVIWLSAPYRDCYGECCKCLEKNMKKIVSTSRSFTPTALDMAGIKVSGDALPDTTASLFSATYVPRILLYLDDHNQAVRLNDIL